MISLSFIIYSLNPETNNCFNHVFYEENKYPMNPVLFPKTKEMQDSLKLDKEKTKDGIILNDVELIYKDENNKFPNFYSCNEIIEKLNSINSCFSKVFKKDKRLEEAELEMQLFRKKKSSIYEELSSQLVLVIQNMPVVWLVVTKKNSLLELMLKPKEVS